MRKKLINLFALIGVIALFTACSSDDKNENPTPNIDYAGFYKGDIVVKLGETEFNPILGKIELIKKNESLAKL